MENLPEVNNVESVNVGQQYLGRRVLVIVAIVGIILNVLLLLYSFLTYLIKGLDTATMMALLISLFFTSLIVSSYAAGVYRIRKNLRGGPAFILIPLILQIVALALFFIPAIFLGL